MGSCQRLNANIHCKTPKVLVRSWLHGLVVGVLALKSQFAPSCIPRLHLWHSQCPFLVCNIYNRNTNVFACIWFRQHSNRKCCCSGFRSFLGAHYSGRSDSQERRRNQRLGIPSGEALHLLSHVEYWCAVRAGWSSQDGGVHKRKLWTRSASHWRGIIGHNFWVSG